MRLGLLKGRFTSYSERVIDWFGASSATPAWRVAAPTGTAWLLKPRDVAALVGAGELDIGLVPTEWVHEAGQRCVVVGDVPGYSARISVLVPADDAVPDGVAELRVATEYPNITRAHLAGRAKRLVIVAAHGSTEAYPPDLADVAVDCVETGTTAGQHGLAEAEVLLDCRMHVVVRPDAPAEIRAKAAELVAYFATPAREPDDRAVRLHSLPPYLRAALLPMVRADRPTTIDGIGAVALAQARGAVPAYMTMWDRATRIAVRDDADLLPALEEYVRGGGLRRDAPDLFSLVVLLSAWDQVIRDVGLKVGRVYLASEEAARMLFPLAGLSEQDAGEFTRLLLEAQSLELIYRFPVAFKFRREYGVENQCRLNGWGRRLAQRALRDPASADLARRWADRLRAHIGRYLDVYEAHIEYVGSQGLTTAPADSWAKAHELPIPILL